MVTMEEHFWSQIYVLVSEALICDELSFDSKI